MSNPLWWLVLALPAIPMTLPVFIGVAEYRSVLTPSGIFAAQLLIVALSVTPLRRLFPASNFVAWLALRRRSIGVAAFAYSLLHLAFFVLSIGRLDYIVQGLAFASMWTGWAAFAMLLLLASTSSNRAMRLMGRLWKRLHRLAYPAAVLVFAHWLLLAGWEALFWFLPLLVLQAMRLRR